MKGTQAEYAGHRGCSRQNVNKLVKAGRINPAIGADGLIDFDLADRLLADDLDPTRRAESPSGGLSEARRRRLTAQADLVEIDLQKRRGELVQAEHVVAGASKVGVAMRQALDASRRDRWLAARTARDEAAGLLALREIDRQLLADLARGLARCWPSERGGDQRIDDLLKIAERSAKGTQEIYHVDP
jgi:hypothetical protein